MFGVVLGIVAGLGEFFIGMKLLSAALKEAASDRVRQVVGRLARRPALTALVGLTAGGLTQSTNAVTAAAAGLATAEIITVRQAFPLIACANIGTSVLVFLAAASLHEAILVATALCGGLYFAGLDQSKRYKAAVGALLGLVLIVAGLEMVTAAARSLRTIPAVQELVAGASSSIVGAFFVGALLTPVVQTAKTVAAIVAALADGGLIAPIDAVSAVVGANLTSAANVAFMTSRISRSGRALAIYQALLKAVGSGIVLPLIVIVSAVDPDILGATGSVHAAMAVAVTYLFAQVVAYAATLPFEGRIERFILGFVGKEADNPARPRFISNDALREPATATTLAFREHVDVLSRLSAHLDGCREGGGGDLKAAAALARNSAAILKATDDFLRALSIETSDDALRIRVGSLQRLNSLAVQIQDQVQSLATIAATEEARTPEVAQRLSAIIESAHTLLDVFVDFVREPDGIGREMLGALTGDRADVMEGVRRAVMSAGSASPAGQKELFDACLCFEHVIWLMKRYLLISNEPGSPFVVQAEEAAQPA